MPFGGLLTVALIAAGTAAAGDISAHTGNTTTATPTLPPAAQGLQNLVTQQISPRLQNNSLPPGYQQQGIAGINSAFAGANTNENAALTARGLADTPVAASVTSQSNLARAGQIGQFNATLPLVQQQQQAQNLTLAQGILTPQRGTTGTGATSAGGGAAGAAGGLSGYLYNLKRNGQSPFGTSGAPAQTPYVDSGGGVSYE